MMDPVRLLGAAFILLAPLLWGFPLYYLLVSSRGWLFLRSFKERLWYFLNPFGVGRPRYMVIIKHLDGSIDVHYDDEIRFQKSEKGVVLWAGGRVYRSTRAPDDVPPVPLAAAFAPMNIFSPYGIAIRLIAGWYASTMLSYVYGIMAVDWLGGLDPLGWVTLMAFIFQFGYTLWLFNSVQSVPVVHKIGYLEVGFNPPYHDLIPDFGVYSSEPVDRYVKILGGKLQFIIPEDIREIFETLRAKLGSAYQAVALLIKVYESDLWRKALTEYRETEASIRELGKSYARRWILQHSFRVTLPRLLVFALIFMLGALVGYVFGSSWAIVPSPPPWYNATSVQSVQYPQAVHTVTTVTPASPPPPPGAVASPTVTPARPPSPPSATVTPTVTPAPPPPPPHATNTTKGVRGA